MFNILKIFFSKLINDILRDKDSEKYSVTKTIAVISFIMLLIIIIMGIYIMIKKNEIDHFLVGELMFFILTLLGFKNFQRADYSSLNKQTKVE
jgi:hypothetical protein